MPSSISFAWSRCHIVVRGGGWSQLVGVPEHLAERTVIRLLELGASSASVIEPCVVQFKAYASVCEHLVQVFPCCPLS
jgi:hypothetical protein